MLFWFIAFCQSGTVIERLGVVEPPLLESCQILVDEVECVGMMIAPNGPIDFHPSHNPGHPIFVVFRRPVRPHRVLHLWHRLVTTPLINDPPEIPN
jgi:hypothetical protein